MKYIKIEICATKYTVSFITKKGKVKKKIFSPYDEWLYHHAPMCDEIIIIPEEKQVVNIAALIGRWKRELRAFFLSRRGRNTNILNIEIEYKAINKKYCADMSVEECLKVMTPEQFFNEFGKFTIDNLRSI